MNNDIVKEARKNIEKAEAMLAQARKELELAMNGPVVKSRDIEKAMKERTKKSDCTIIHVAVNSDGSPVCGEAPSWDMPYGHECRVSFEHQDGILEASPVQGSTRTNRLFKLYRLDFKSMAPMTEDEVRELVGKPRNQ